MEGLGEVLAAQRAYRVDRVFAERIAFDGDGQNGEITGLVGLHLGAAERGSPASRSRRRSIRALHRGRVGIAVDHDLDRLGGLAGKLVVQGEISLLGGEPIRKRAHTGLTRSQAKHRRGHREQDRGGEHETGDRPPHHRSHRPRPERTLLAACGAPEERDAAVR